MNKNQNQNQNQNKNRSRGRNNNNNRRGPSRGNNFESNGPEVKVRGTAQQVLDKYLQLARDAQSSGDRINAEGYLQYAEHYYRIINSETNAPANAGAGSGLNPSNNVNDAARTQSNGQSSGNGANSESLGEQTPVPPSNEKVENAPTDNRKTNTRAKRENKQADEAKAKPARPAKDTKPAARRRAPSATAKEQAPA